MLRNVAIPLMLAASEAEAQTPEQIKAAAFAMKMDKDFEIPELTPASNELNECQEGTNDAIAAAVGVVTAKQNLVDEKKALYEADILAADATATVPVLGGPWTIANNARKAAVEAAEAAEAAGTDLGVLLDSLNGLHELERAAAKTFYDASVDVANGVIDAAEKLAEYNRLNGLKNSTLVLKEAADAAVLAATTAITDEETSRNWLYCELGAVPAFTLDSDGDTTVDSWSTDYVPFTQDLTGNGSADETLPTSWHAAQTPTVVALPPSCTVPRVLSAGVATPGVGNANEGDSDGTLCTAACAAAELAAAGTCASSTYDDTAVAGSKCMFMTETRPEIKYFNTQASGGVGEVDETNFLAAETNVLKWNATLALTQAQATLSAATGTILPSTGSIDRTTAGKIAYYEGLEKKYKWLKVQRTREQEFFRVIKSGATNALAEANNHIQGTGTALSPQADYDIPSSGASEIYGWPSTWGSSSDITNDTLAGSPSAINRFDAGYAGASKGLAAAVTARARTTAWVSGEVGSLYRMHSARTFEANGWAITVGTLPTNVDANWDKREYVSIWTNTPDTSDGVDLMNAWTAAQNTATTTNESALYKWWKAAYGASKIANDWALLFTNAGAKAEWVAATATATVDSTGTADVVCDGTLTTTPWQAAAGGNASETLCQAACVDYNKDVTNGIAAKDTAGALRTWGTGVYIPRETTGGKWCTAFSYADSNDACHINVMTASTVNDNLHPTSQSGAWGKGAGGGAAGKCKNMTADTDPGNSTTPTTNEMLNFANYARQYPAAYDLGKSGDTAGLYAAMVADVATQAGLETAWLQAYYYHQYWLAIQHMLTTSTTGKAKSYNDYHTVVSATTASNPEWETNGVTNLDNANMVNLQAARNELAYKQVDIALKTAHVTLLGSQINRVQQQIEDLRGLTAPAVTANTGTGISARDAGELTAAQTKRQATYDLYNGVDPDYSASVASTANDDAIATLVERNFTTHPLVEPTDTARTITLEGDLAYAKRMASEAWSAAQQNVSDKGDEITAAESTATLASLRTAVEETGAAWVNANATMMSLRSAMTNAMGELAVAEKDLVDTTLACQVAAYDKYRQVLDEALQTREEDLATIKAMLEDLATEPAPGTAGSRCEKALSNGTYRPKRGEETCGGKDSGLCCGGARVWMKSGTTEGAGWRTIETCQLDTTETYAYQPPREPMSIQMPATESVAFACIEGAKALAAAASAAAAAVYMLA